MTPSRFQKRRDQLLRLVRRADSVGILVTTPANVRYLTGFTGEDSYLLLSPDATVMLSDPRFSTQLEEECPELDLVLRRPGKSLVTVAGQALKSARLSRVAFESDHVSVGLADQLRDKVKTAQWRATSGLVEELREIKDKQEVESIRRAIMIAERGYTIARAGLQDAQTEQAVAAGLEYQMRLLGGEGASFETIVAVGDRAALPHYRPGLNHVHSGAMLLIDWGTIKQGYRSDLTRVLFTKRPTKKHRQIYETVLKAQQAAIDAIRPGVVMGDVDKVARSVITRAGFGKRFGHSLGHGIGLDIHEAPKLAQKENRPLRAGMVVTVEPGIYLPGWGGVRIEDDVLVTRSGCEVLSNLPKGFDECVELEF